MEFIKDIDNKIKVIIGHEPLNEDLYKINYSSDKLPEIFFDTIEDLDALDNSDLYNAITELDIDNLFSIFSEITFSYPWYFSDSYDAFYIESISLLDINNRKALVKITIDNPFDKWKRLWSILDNGVAFKNSLEKYNLEGLNFPNWNSDDLFESVINGIRFELEKEASGSISDIVSELIDYVQEAYSDANEHLSLRLKSDTLVRQFNFPEETKSACEQYLIYFTSFLKDIGIAATSEIQEITVNEVLFSVTPLEKTQALSQIREALDIYLNLPRNQSINFMNPAMDLASQQLAINISHFKGQLILANAIIQQKELTIKNQAQLINQQSVANDILVKSLQTQNEEEDTEGLVGELVKIKKAEWEFIELDLPEMLRWLKSKFSKKNIT